MRRALVLKSAIAETEHEHQLAINARSTAVQAVSRDPTNDLAHKALDAAAAAVRSHSARLDQLQSALTEAERLDHMDEVNAKKAGWIAAREKAIALSSARVKQAKALQAAIDNMAVALRDFETANDAALVAIYQATAGAAPKDHQAMVVFGQRAAIAPRAVTDPLRAAFVMALHDSGFGEVGLSLDGMLTYQNHQHLAHGNRDGLVAAVKQSTQAIDDALTDVHKLVGVIAPDPVIEFEPTIVSPDDPNAGVIPAVEWGAPAVPAIGARLMPSGG